MPLQQWFEFTDCHTSDLLASERVRLRAEHCVCAAGEPGEPGAYEEIIFSTTLLIPCASLASPAAAAERFSLDDVSISSLMTDPTEIVPADHPLSRLRELIDPGTRIDALVGDSWQISNSLQAHLDEHDHVADPGPSSTGNSPNRTGNVFDLSECQLRVYSDASFTTRKISILRPSLEHYLHSVSCLMFYCSYRYRACCLDGQSPVGIDAPETVRRLNDNQVWRGRVYAEKKATGQPVVDCISELYSQGWVMPRQTAKQVDSRIEHGQAETRSALATG